MFFCCWGLVAVLWRASEADQCFDYRILHFVTFVIACVETNKRNRLRHTTQVVYVNGGPQYPPQNQPPQYPPQNQPPMYPPVAGPEQAYQYGGMKA